MQPHVEYCMLILSPYLIKCIAELEKGQNTEVRMIKGLGRLSYDRL